MSFADLADIISSFRTPGGITLVQHTRAAPVNGRASLPHATVTVLADAAHHPGLWRKVSRREGVSVDADVTAYFRQEVKTAMVEPNGNDPWWFIIAGIAYEVVDVQPWTQGSFWVVTGKAADRFAQQDRVFFGELTNLQAASTASALAALQANLSAFAPMRDFRVDFAAQAKDVVAVAWPASLDAADDAVTFKATDAQGNSVDVEALSVATSSGFVVAILPKVPGPSGRLQYEVA